LETCPTVAWDNARFPLLGFCIVAGLAAKLLTRRSKLRVVFLGTPECAVVSLRALVREKFDVVAVVTRPDAPKGRSLHVSPSPVKEAAVEANLPVYQFEKASSADGVERIRLLAPDVIVVVAFGEILSDEFLKIPKLAIVNVHFSLLPKYRGAAPVQWAIINGEKETGATIQHLAKKLDTGDIILQEKVPISDEDTAGTLSKKLAEVGARLLVKALRQLESGTAPRIPQDESQASLARKLTKEDGKIDWSWSAAQIVSRIRGTNPWPGAYTFFSEKGERRMLKIFVARAHPETADEPGRVVLASDRFIVAAGEGAVEPLSVQPEAKREMLMAEFLRGHHVGEGAILG
jgi:methionyl-tRNA formyltransferase